MIEQVETLTTPLLRQVGRFGRWLAVAALAASTMIFVFGVVVHGQPASEMFLAAVGLAVAAIPEELPAILTIAIAFGVQRMAGRNAIVRRLPSVETLGSVTVICSDKTGTLTRNEMALETVATAQRVYRVTGLGYRPRGDVLIDGGAMHPSDHPVLLELARGASLCSDARVRRDGEAWHVDGDPMEGAIVAFAGKLGIAADEVRATMPRLDVLPFESERRLMASLHRNGPDAVVYVKGAPERVLALCDRQRESGGDVSIDMPYWHGGSRR
jgi:magnesium-transporting ATPase (P-type)